MDELTINLHMHTTYSDGSGSHAELGSTALECGVDVLLVTDHNVLVQGVDAYYRNGTRKALVLACEEIHDQARDPQKNHLLVFGTDHELSTLASDTQALINAVQAAGGICFIAHPLDQVLPAFNETDITWVNWGANGYTGIELWNGFSELKTVARGKWQAIAYALFPVFIPHGPTAEILELWDRLIAAGQRVVAVGGSDAHAEHLSLGPLRKTVFPYAYHFSTINTHTLVSEPLSGDLSSDRRMVFEALANGHCFIGNDLPAPTHGFRFSAQGKDKRAIMGDEIAGSAPLMLQVNLPSPASVHLLKDGKQVKSMDGELLTYLTDGPGVYRVEAYKFFLGRKRGWIFSNPIYVR